MAPQKRLSKAERRAQLLDVAMAIVRAEGTDALTLAYVAEQAGVTKPIAYEHFETREGLLTALYKRLDDEQMEALEQALARTPRRLEDVARVLARSCMRYYVSMGPEFKAISAALKGTEAMVAFQQELLDGYLRSNVEAFSPFVDMSREDLRLRCVALLGASEAIAQEMLRHKASEARAAATLEALMIAALR